MRRRVVILCLVSLSLAACSRSEKSPVASTANDASIAGSAGSQPGAGAIGASFTSRPMPGGENSPQPAGYFTGPTSGPMAGMPLSENERQDRYNAAVAEAMELLIAGKLEQALAAFDHARSFAESDVALRAVTRTRQRLDQNSA